VTIGQWDPELFSRYRAATGERRRLLASRIIRENEPLCITLVEQLCGRADRKQRRRGRSYVWMQSDNGFEEIPFEDAMQAARFALGKVLDQYDPEKGGVAGYLRGKIFYELQRLRDTGQFFRMPRRSWRDRPSIDLMPPLPAGEDHPELERMGSDLPWFALGDVEGLSAEDVERWQASGEWPDSEEAWRADVAPGRAVDTRTALAAFLEDELVYGPGRRETRLVLEHRWGVFAMARGAWAAWGRLRCALVQRGCREATVRSAWSSVARGFRGVSLRTDPKGACYNRRMTDAYLCRGTVINA
jgi:hypothetical protein